MKRIRYFNAEKQAEKAKRKYSKYKSTKNYKWTIQGNTLTRIRRK